MCLSIFILIGCSSSDNKYEINDSNITLNLPEDLSVKSTVIYDNKKRKIGEFLPSTELMSGREHIEIYKNGFVDDSKLTVFISGDSLEINNKTWYLATRKNPYESANGNTGYWYSHNFMHRCNDQSIFITLYDYKGKLPKWTERILMNIKCSVNKKTLTNSA